MHQKGIDPRLHILQIIGIGGTFVAAAAACRVVGYRRRPAPEVFILAEALPGQRATYYFPANFDGVPRPFAGSGDGDQLDE